MKLVGTTQQQTNIIRSEAILSRRRRCHGRRGRRDALTPAPEAFELQRQETLGLLLPVWSDKKPPPRERSQRRGSEPRRRGTYPTTDEEGARRGEDEDAEREARRAARRARRAEKEAADRAAAEQAAEEARRAKDESRRERRRRQEEEDEARRQEEKEARRAERRAQRARKTPTAALPSRKKPSAPSAEDGVPKWTQRRPRPRPAVPPGIMSAAGATNQMVPPARMMKSVADAEMPGVWKRRDGRLTIGMPDADTKRRTTTSTRGASRENTGGSWPHSGTSSWVKEHSDAPPPREWRGCG